jgi:hypothetical protein
MTTSGPATGLSREKALERDATTSLVVWDASQFPSGDCVGYGHEVTRSVKRVSCAPARDFVVT